AHERGLPKARFDMHITGSKIPSWFTCSKYVSVTDMAVAQNCPPTEWVGFVLCFMLVRVDDQPELCDHEVSCYLYGTNGGDCSQIEFVLKHNCCDSLQVVKCGSRLVFYVSLDFGFLSIGLTCRIQEERQVLQERGHVV
ncbi:hypothetical protein L195_g046605, partial [Trifolium pratense]